MKFHRRDYLDRGKIGENTLNNTLEIILFLNEGVKIQLWNFGEFWEMLKLLFTCHVSTGIRKKAQRALMGDQLISLKAAKLCQKGGKKGGKKGPISFLKAEINLDYSKFGRNEFRLPISWPRIYMIMLLERRKRLACPISPGLFFRVDWESLNPRRSSAKVGANNLPRPTNPWPRERTVCPPDCELGPVADSACFGDNPNSHENQSRGKKETEWSVNLPPSISAHPSRWPVDISEDQFHM